MVLALIVAVLVIVVAVIIPTFVARRRGYLVGGRVVVRCRQGHLFTTIWTPGASLKAVRLGWWRFQHCPVGDHWSLVRPVKEAELTDEQRRAAHEIKDVAIP